MPDSKRFLLRLNPRLFDALRRWAQDDLRSINAQIEYLLTEQARRAGRLPRHNGDRRFPDTDTPPDIDDLTDPEGPLAPTTAPDDNAYRR